MEKIYQLLADGGNLKDLITWSFAIIGMICFVIITLGFSEHASSTEYKLVNPSIAILIVGLTGLGFSFHITGKLDEESSKFLKTELLLNSENETNIHIYSNTVLVEVFKNVSEKIPNCVALDDSQSNSCFKNVRINDYSLKIVTQDKVGSSAWKKKIHENRDALIKVKKQQASNYSPEQTVAL